MHAPTVLLALVWLLPAIAIAAPPNDACIDATTVAPSALYEETLDSTTATTAIDDPLQLCTLGGANQNAHSVWYKFTAPANGVLAVDTLGSGSPTIISVHTGACGLLSELACTTSTLPTATSLATPVVSGTTYRIELTNQAGSPGGTVQVHVSFVPDSPICPQAGGTFVKANLSLVGLHAEANKQRIKLKGTMVLEDPLPSAISRGMQLLIEDVDDYYAPVAAWTAQTIAIPPGAPGTGCFEKDGWVASKTGSTYRYRNISFAFPPACAGYSARGLTEVRLHRSPTDPRIVDVKVRVKNTTLLQNPTLSGKTARIRLSVTVDSEISPTNVEDCAHSQPIVCKLNGSESSLACKIE